MIRKFLLRMLVSVLLLALLWCGGLVWYMAQIPREAAHDDSRTDAIVVLTGGKGRIDYGLELLAQGRADRLFISGVEGNLTAKQLLKDAPAEIADSLRHKPEAVIMLGHDARNTIGNAMEAGEWMRGEKLGSIRLVTANYHMPRALAEFRYALPDAAIIPDPVFPGQFAEGEWWESDSAMQLIFSEYHKYLAARFRHVILILTKK